MDDLNRAGIFELTLVFGYTLGVFLLVSSLMSMRQKVRDPWVALIRSVGGLALIVSLLVFHSTESFDIFPVNNLTDLWSVLTIGASVFVAVGMGDLAVYRVASLIDGVFEWMGQRFNHNRFVSGFTKYSGAVGVVAVSVLVVVAVLPEIKLREVTAPPPTLRQSSDFEVILEATYSLPGNPMDLVFSGKSEGYITLAQGQVIQFELPEDVNGDLKSRVVTKDLDNPRGLTIFNEVLYVVDIGALPCPEIRCKGVDIPGLDYFEAEAKILEESNGGIFAFDVLADGDLGEKRTTLTGLPAANYQHGPNGIEVGPDGLLYVSIGGLDSLYDQQAILDTIQGPNLELVGTIIRFQPDGGGLEIFAKGLRNVYGLTFDDRGLLFAVDNDGLTRGGWRREEVLQIKNGANYGYPYEGTFGPHQVRDDNPVWILNAVGAAGIEYAGNLGLGPGLIIGACNQLHYLAMADYDDGRLLATREDAFLLATIPGCVTIVEPGPDQSLIVGVFDTSSLHSFKLTAN